MRAPPARLAMMMRLSGVMTRGSAPMVWTQTPWLRYTPFVATAPVERSADYGALHLSRLTAIYGTPLVAVSLISEKGRAAERVIAEGYDQVVAKYKREVAMQSQRLSTANEPLMET